MSRRSLVLWILAAVVALAASWIRLPYYAVGPGPAREVVPLIDVTGTTTFDSGRLVMTTVSFRQVTAVTALGAWIDPNRAVVGQDLLYPAGETVAEERQRSLSQMDTSKIDASYVALDRLTDYPKEHADDGVLIEQVGSACPAEGKLFAGDLVESIDGTAITDVTDASAAIDAVDPGDPITFHVRAAGEEHDIVVTRGDCPGADGPKVGISMVNDFPFDIEIASGDIGGPSAGMMFALGLYDLLTPGDLADGRIVAGTGTIDGDGAVGPIGGIADKIVAARGVGAQVFLCPRDNYAEAKGADAGDMRIVPVSTFDEALAALGATTPAPSPSPTA
jgi:PDZ domain-containing protein